MLEVCDVDVYVPKCLGCWVWGQNLDVHRRSLGACGGRTCWVLRVVECVLDVLVSMCFVSEMCLVVCLFV